MLNTGSLLLFTFGYNIYEIVHHTARLLHPIYPSQWMGLQQFCAALRSLLSASCCSGCMLSDVMLFSGVKIIFRVGLVLLKSMLGSQEKLKACQGLYETMELLRAIQPQYMKEAFLVQEVQYYYPRLDPVSPLKVVFLLDFALLWLCRQPC